MAKNIRTTEVQALVSIAGERVNFIRLSLSQEMGQQHEPERDLRHDYGRYAESLDGERPGLEGGYRLRASVPRERLALPATDVPAILRTFLLLGYGVGDRPSP